MNSMQKYTSLAAIIMLAGTPLTASAQETEENAQPAPVSKASSEGEAQVEATPSFDELFADVDAETAARNEETAARNEETAARNEETAARNEETAARNEETTTRNENTERELLEIARKLKEEIPAD